MQFIIAKDGPLAGRLVPINEWEDFTGHLALDAGVKRCAVYIRDKGPLSFIRWVDLPTDIEGYSWPPQNAKEASCGKCPQPGQV